MYYGVCYYPEHWPEDRWDTDIKLMQAAGFNILRLAEFAWARMEPEEGRFVFEWLDAIIEKAAAAGMKVMLGTPTAAPPKWLCERHPDIYQEDPQGHVKGFGTRRHYCYNNQSYHQYVRRFVSEMASHYRDRREVMGWQIDNELGAINTTRCYCEDCRLAFMDWLKEKYVSIDALNEAWGTIFSSQTYGSWEQLHLPTYSVHQSHNPGMALDFRRFSSDSVRAFQRIQIDALRHITPNHPITTNGMANFNEIDYYKLSSDLDIMSVDIYPNIKRGLHGQLHYTAAQHDMTRGFKKQNYWITEHQSGAPGVVTLHPTPKPGDLRRWTYQSIAHGADAIIYFRWRSCTFGIEQYWHGILPHYGGTGRVYEEVKQLGEEIKKLSPLIEGSTPAAKVAILRCFHNEWVFEIQPHVREYTYMKHLADYYRYFFEKGIPVDIVSPDTDLVDYDLVIAPNLIMAEEHTVERLHSYVRNGGRAVFDFRAGAKEWNNRMAEEKLPGRFRELLGIEIEDYGIIDPEEPAALQLKQNGRAGLANTWYDLIKPCGAVPLAVFTSDYYAGSPAVTQHAYGHGEAYYFGTEPERSVLYELLEEICQNAGIRPLLPDLPADVEVMCRYADERHILFVMNHGREDREVTLPGPFIEIISGTEMEGINVLPANGVWLLTSLDGAAV
ncbi:MAG: beta-galactosidase [Paenibacillus sp.]|jgi:beta-galactosidase|nr:beta-galactosidase [Paenibacillus sp.]